MVGRRRPTDWTTDGRWKSGAGAADIACDCRCPGATRWRCGKYRGSHGEMHPAGTDWPCRRISGGRGGSKDAPGRSQRPAAGTSRHTAGGGLARLSESSRGATGQAESLIEAGTVVATEAVAVAGEASPATRDRDPVAATPSTPNKRPAANVGNGAPRVAASDGMATASRGTTQQCGSDTSLRDGGSPSKTNPYAGPGRLTRRRARSIPSASPPKKVPQAQRASLRRTAFRAIPRLADCSTRGR